MDEQASLRARQGVAYHTLEDVSVIKTGPSAEEVEANGLEMGEVCFKGNMVMKVPNRESSKASKLRKQEQERLYTSIYPILCLSVGARN